MPRIYIIDCIKNTTFLALLGHYYFKSKIQVFFPQTFQIGAGIIQVLNDERNIGFAARISEQ